MLKSPSAATAVLRSARYERQRERIVEAAVSILNEKGVGGMALQEVAQALELKTTSVTYYYRYKEQLAAAVFDDTLSRLADMVKLAALEQTPRDRVARYVELFFEETARSLRGEQRPLAILSEMRTLEEGVRRPLIKAYQEIFRAVRSLFGSVDSVERRIWSSARAQVLNEALFWSGSWLRRYPLRDWHNVRRRMLDILGNGIAARSDYQWEIVCPDIGEPMTLKDNFLCAASRLINDIGYKGASVEKIVEELGVTKGSFYHVLEAKDNLVQDCYREDYRRLARLQELIEPSQKHVTAGLASSFASTLNLQFDGIHPLLRTTALQAMPRNVREGARARFDHIALRLSGTLTDGMTDGSVRIVDPMIAANIIISTINSAYDLRGWAKRQPREEAIRIYGSTLMSGLFSGD